VYVYCLADHPIVKFIVILTLYSILDLGLATNNQFCLFSKLVFFSSKWVSCDNDEEYDDNILLLLVVVVLGVIVVLVVLTHTPLLYILDVIVAN